MAIGASRSRRLAPQQVADDRRRPPRAARRRSATRAPSCARPRPASSPARTCSSTAAPTRGCSDGFGRRRRHVLIVGAGPVGWSWRPRSPRRTSTSWSSSGERDAQRAPAAHVVNARTFEICAPPASTRLAIDAACQPPTDGGVGPLGDHARRRGARQPPVRAPGRRPCSRVTPTPLRNLSQHRLEPILRDHVASLPSLRRRVRHRTGVVPPTTATAVTSTVVDRRAARTRRDPQPLADRRRRRRQSGAQGGRHRAGGPDRGRARRHDPLRGRPARSRARSAGRALLDHRSGSRRRLRRARHRRDVGAHARLRSGRRGRRVVRRGAMRASCSPRGRTRRSTSRSSACRPGR